MKKIVFLLVIASILTLSSNADQLAYISKNDAIKATNYLKGQSNVVLWCACCDSEVKQLTTIIDVYYEHTGYEQYYQVILEGRNINNQNVKKYLDLAYVHINKTGKAVCLGTELGLECDPCTAPFNYPNASNYATVNTVGNFPDNLLRIRSTPATAANNSNFIVAIPHESIVEVLDKDAKRDVINGETGYWMKIRYTGISYDKTVKELPSDMWEGYAWGNFLKLENKEE